jgi:hypothetical protein
MDQDSVFVLSIVIPLVTIIGGCLLVGLAIYRYTRLKELAYRERLAMIEKGLVPGSLDPAGSDRVKQLASVSRHERGMRMRTLGVVLLGVGLGLAVLISFAGEDPASGVGVGGGIAVLGLAFLVNGILTSRSSMSPGYPVSQAPERESQDRAPFSSDH